MTAEGAFHLPDHTEVKCGSVFQFCTFLSFFLFFKSAQTSLVANKTSPAWPLSTTPQGQTYNTLVKVLLWKVPEKETHSEICFSVSCDRRELLGGSSQVWNKLPNKQAKVLVSQKLYFHILIPAHLPKSIAHKWFTQSPKFKEKKKKNHKISKAINSSLMFSLKHTLSFSSVTLWEWSQRPSCHSVDGKCPPQSHVSKHFIPSWRCCSGRLWKL